MTWQKDMLREVLLENKDVLIDIIKEIQPVTPTNIERKKLRNEHIQEKYDISSTTATRWINALEVEQNRLDSKVPSDSVVWASERTRIVDADIFDWFLEHRNVLADSIRRKGVQKYGG